MTAPTISDTTNKIREQISKIRNGRPIWTTKNESFATEFEDKIILTRGGNGAYYNGQDFPSEKKVTIDVSGAGDTFLAALAFHFMTSRNMSKAIQEANKAACKVVSQRGVSVI